MPVEPEIALAEGAEAGFAGFGAVEAVLRALAVAQVQVLAAEAFRRQGIALVDAELHLPGRLHHRPDGGFGDVPEPILRVDEMVAGVEVPVVLDDGVAAAGAVVGAGAGHHAAPVRQGGVEQAHEGPSHVVPHPVVEDVAHELAEAQGGDRPGGEARAFGRGGDDATLFHVFDHRHELHIPAAERLQEAVHFQPAALGDLVHRGHRVEFDPMGPQEPDAADDLVEGARAAPVLPVLVVDVAGTVDGNAHKEAVLPQEIGPFGGEEGAVRLQGVEDRLPVGILPFQFHRLPVEVQPEHQRLAAVPVEGDLGDVVGRDVLPDYRLQHLQAHPGLPSAVDIGLVQVIAVRAPQVAKRPGRLEHDVERRRPGDPDRVLEQQLVLERMRHGTKIRKSPA